MPVTDQDHLSHMRQRLQNRLKEIDNERLEVLEMLQTIDRMPKVLAKSPTVSVSSVQQPQPVKSSNGRQLQNRDVTARVREFIANFEAERVIKPNEIVDQLLQTGARGKRRSLYSAVCVILRKETEPKGDAKPRLAYEKGVGFYKPKTFGQKLGQAPTMGHSAP